VAEALDGSGTMGWIWGHDNVIRRNVLAHNLETQLWGFFGLSDQRHLPKALQDAAKIGDPAAELWQRCQEGAEAPFPTGLSLESLNLTLEGNVYAVEDGQGLFSWGAPSVGARHYPSLDEVRRELPLERGSIQGAFACAGVAALDLRVPAGSPALRLGCYPRGRVPGVQLGAIRTSASRSARTVTTRGAATRRTRKGA
jgi:hypothetical protein